MKWNDYFNQYFYRLTDEEADLWEDEIIRKTPGLTGSDILAAVRQLESTERPKLRHMLVQCAAIVKSRTHSENEPSPECSICYKGWIQYLPPASIYSETGVSIPCLCSLGDHWREEKYEERHWAKLRRMASTAMEQHKERQEQGETIGLA